MCFLSVDYHFGTEGVWKKWKIVKNDMFYMKYWKCDKCKKIILTYYSRLTVSFDATDDKEQ